MIKHTMIKPTELRNKIRSKELMLGGHHKLKIYGQLSCKSGKRMKKENRVFFTNETEALRLGFRPCGRCMHTAYKQWKHGAI